MDIAGVDVEIDVIKEYPELEDLVVNPSTEDQNFSSSKYGFKSVTINAIKGESLDLNPSTEQQNVEGVFTKVKLNPIKTQKLNTVPSTQEQVITGLFDEVIVNAIEGETLNLNPSEEQQSAEGVFTQVNVNPIQVEEITTQLDFSSSDTIELKPETGAYLKKATINKDINLTPENIKTGVSISGISGQVADTSDADATSGDIRLGKTAYVNNKKVQGTFKASNHNATVSMQGLTGTAFTVAKTLKTIDFGNVDTSSMKSFSGAFQSLSGLEEIIGLNTIQATNMQNMFSGCSALKTIPELTTNKVTSMSSMFSGCSSLTTIPLLNTSSVSNVSSMFQNCTNLTTVPLLNLTSVNSMSGMFNGCTKLKSVPAFTPSGLNLRMNIMFYNCTNLTDVPVISTNNTADMQNMFLNCSSLSNDSLNNIMTMCINATRNISSTYRTLKYIGLTSEQATRCISLSNYADFTNSGWSTGY